MSKGPVVNQLYFRVIEDIRYVMSHLEVAKYIAQERQELARAWLHLLAFVQGMYPQHRIINIHVEEEDEDWRSAYLLEVQMATVHPLFVAGAAASGNGEVRLNNIPEHKPENDLGKTGCEKSISDLDVMGPAKVGCHGGEAAAVACSTSGGPVLDVEMYNVTSVVDVRPPSEASAKVGERREATVGSTMGMTMSAPLTWLISECTQVLDIWLALDVSRGIVKSGHKGIDVGHRPGLRGGLWWWGRGLNQGVMEPTDSEAERVSQGRGRTMQEWLQGGRHFLVPVAPAASANQAADMDVDVLHPRGGKGVLVGKSARPEWWMGLDTDVSWAGVGQLFEDNEWPAVDYDVSKQEVSYHVPLHRMLGLLLHKALELYSSESDGFLVREGSSAANSGFLEGGRLLAELFPTQYQVPGFAAVLMEHPLRLQVLCAQVLAGMWRHNGYTASVLCDLYHNVHWWVLWVPSIVMKSKLIKSSGQRKRKTIESKNMNVSWHI